MKRTADLLACALTALLAATAASAEITVGVGDDLPIGAPGVAADFYAAMQDVGLRENRIAVKWDRPGPTAIASDAGLERPSRRPAHGVSASSSRSTRCVRAL